MIWTKPDDWTPDAEDPLTGLIGLHPAGFVAAFCDGHVTFISEYLDPSELMTMLTVAGGEVVNGF